MQFLSDLVKCCTLSIRTSDPFTQESSTSPTSPKIWTSHTHKNNQKMVIQTCFDWVWDFDPVPLKAGSLAKTSSCIISHWLEKYCWWSLKWNWAKNLISCKQRVVYFWGFFPLVLYNKKSGVFFTFHGNTDSSFQLLVFKKSLQCIYWL